MAPVGLAAPHIPPKIFPESGSDLEDNPGLAAGIRRTGTPGRLPLSVRGSHPLASRRIEMTVCPIAIAVGCKKCPVFSVCPVKGIIGDYKKEDESKSAPAGKGKSGAKPSK
jgi:hypothetical protein